MTHIHDFNKLQILNFVLSGADVLSFCFVFTYNLHISYNSSPLSVIDVVSCTTILGKAFPVLPCESPKNEPILRTSGSWSVGRGEGARMDRWSTEHF